MPAIAVLVPTPVSGRTKPAAPAAARFRVRVPACCACDAALLASAAASGGGGVAGGFAAVRRARSALMACKMMFVAKPVGRPFFPVAESDVSAASSSASVFVLKSVF